MTPLVPDDDPLAPPRFFPRHLPRSSGRLLAGRAAQIARVSARNFGSLAVRRAARRTLPENAFARPLRLTFEELGGTFMKFGQLIGSAPGVFGDDVAAEFRACLDTGAPVPLDDVRAAIEADLGMALGEAFASFDPEPIGRASIAVVHRARLHDGRAAAVKVLRPGIEQSVATDLDLLQPLLELVARQTGDQLAGSLLQMFDGFREQIGEELDLRNEARAMQHYRALLGVVDLPLVTVPEPYPKLSSARVLTMEFLDGVPVDDLARAREFGYDPRPIVEQVVRGFLLTAIRWGNFHGDVHAGNLLLLRDGRIGVLDWGIVGRLDPRTHRFFRRMIEAGLGDESAWDDVAQYFVENYGPAMREAMGLSEGEVVALVRSISEPILTRPFGEVSLATLLQSPQQQAAAMRGVAIHHERSPLAVLRRFREQRRIRAAAEAHGGVMSDFDRGLFLLSKQLLYFERYGKMFLADTSLLADREFFRAVLAEPHAAA